METKRGMCRAGSRGTPEAVPEGTGSLKWAGRRRGAGAGAPDGSPRASVSFW